MVGTLNNWLCFLYRWGTAHLLAVRCTAAAAVSYAVAKTRSVLLPRESILDNYLSFPASSTMC